MTKQVRISTRLGPLTGVVRDGRVDVTGIRYAVSEGQGRVREVRVGDDPQAPMAAFPQLPGALDSLLGPALGELPQSDDAFQLRIQAPEGATSAPVVVFIHGGGFLSGSGNSRWYEQPSWVLASGSILVTLNYRVGALGHLLGEEGANAPFTDLLRAIRWVREHVHLFGGDSENLTLAGDSAGAWYVYALCLAPELAGSIQRGLLVSMPRIAPQTQVGLSVVREEMQNRLGGSLHVPSADLVQAQSGVLREKRLGMALRPTVGECVPEDLVDYRSSASRLHVPELLLMRTAEESAGFLRNLPRDSVLDENVDTYVNDTFEDPDVVSASLRASGPADPYLDLVRAHTLADFVSVTDDIVAAAPEDTAVNVVRCDVQSGLAGAYSPHCFLLPMIFDGPAAWRDAPMLDGVDVKAFEHAGNCLRALISRFVVGKPTGLTRGVTVAVGSDVQEVVEPRASVKISIAYP